MGLHIKMYIAYNYHLYNCICNYEDDKYMGGRDFLWKNGWSYWLQPVS